MLDVLKKFDFLSEPHIVGGAVRDKIIGRETNDIDIATSDTPDTVVKKLNANGIKAIDKLGKEHGTVFAVLDGFKEPIEITTFRRDINTDGRHAEVEFTDDLEIDLARRDFTMNAMAMDLNGDIKDPFGGREDIYKGIITTVGDPQFHFAEDYLRIIRAIRFLVRYDYFKLEKETLYHIKEYGHIVPYNVSIERIVSEFNKAFKSPNPGLFIQCLLQINLLQPIIPEFEFLNQFTQDPVHHPEGDVLTHICNVIDRSNPNPLDRWAALLHDIGKAITAKPVPIDKRIERWKEAGHSGNKSDIFYSFHKHDSEGAEIVEQIADDLKFSNARKEALVKATKLHMQPLYAENQGSPISDKQIRRFQQKAGEHLDLIQRLAEADHQRGDSPLFKDMPEPIDPILKGRHLIETGHAPGPHFGPALDAALDAQLDEGITAIDKLYEIAKPHLDD